MSMKTSIQNSTIVFNDRLERADLLIEYERIGADLTMIEPKGMDLCAK
jgi:hypothetical protein